jgi:polynucleotide 5'-kinase involved in rRNA processing
VYWYGDVTPSSNPDLYKLQISNLLRDVNRRMELKAEGTPDWTTFVCFASYLMWFARSLSLSLSLASVGGLIVNTCGWIDGVGYDLIRHAIDATRATVILVLDNERLYSDLQQDLSQVQDRRIRTSHLAPRPPRCRHAVH